MEANEGFSSRLNSCGALEISLNLQIYGDMHSFGVLNKISTLSHENKTLKAINESLCKDKNEPTCPKKPGFTWPQIRSVSSFHESTVFSPDSAPLLRMIALEGCQVVKSRKILILGSSLLGKTRFRENSQVMWKRAI